MDAVSKPILPPLSDTKNIKSYMQPHCTFGRNNWVSKRKRDEEYEERKRRNIKKAQLVNTSLHRKKYESYDLIDFLLFLIQETKLQQPSYY